MSGGLGLRSRVQEALGRVSDPCSIARGTPIGLVDMGLVIDIRLDERAEGTVIHLTLRMTTPGCMYWTYFETAAKTELMAINGVLDVLFSWSDAYDWDPDMMSARGRELMASHADSSKWRGHDSRAFHAGIGPADSRR